MNEDQKEERLQTIEEAVLNVQGYTRPEELYFSQELDRLMEGFDNERL